MKHVAQDATYKKSKTIALCSSVSFYRELLAIEKELKKRGFKVLVPYTAKEMGRTGNFKVGSYKTWHGDPAAYKRKSFLMRHHFRKIVKSDAILVLNLARHEQEGYIGGNVLMEMALAFHLRKLIYLYREASKESLMYEEIMGMQPVCVEENLTNIFANC